MAGDGDLYQISFVTISTGAYFYGLAQIHHGFRVFHWWVIYCQFWYDWMLLSLSLSLSTPSCRHTKVLVCRPIVSCFLSNILLFCSSIGPVIVQHSTVLDDVKGQPCFAFIVPLYVIWCCFNILCPFHVNNYNQRRKLLLWQCILYISCPYHLSWWRQFFSNVSLGLAPRLCKLHITRLFDSLKSLRSACTILYWGAGPRDEATVELEYS